MADTVSSPKVLRTQSHLGRASTLLSANMLTIDNVIRQYDLQEELQRVHAEVKVYDRSSSQLVPVTPSQLSQVGDGVWVGMVLHRAPTPGTYSVQEWLEVLASRFNLPALSLVNAVTPDSDDVKVDRTEDCLYVSLLAFACDHAAAAATQTAARSPPSAATAEAKEQLSMQRQRLAHREADVARQMSEVYHRHQPGWQRVGLFLTEHALVSVFEEGPVLHNLRAYLPKAVDFQYGLGFLFYRIIERTVKLTPKLVGVYEQALIQTENMVLGQSQRPTYKQDVDTTKELHLMRNELGLIKHMVSPVQRVLNTVLTEYGGASTSKLVGAVAADYLEEVVDKIISLNEDIEAAISNCEQVSNLVFNLSTYHDNKNGSVLTMIATIFLPLTWLCGIYGMNFDILPELHWRLGYLYFWMVSLAMTILVILWFALGQGLFRRLGVVGPSTHPLVSKAWRGGLGSLSSKRQGVSARDVSRNMEGV